MVDGWTGGIARCGRGVSVGVWESGEARSRWWEQASQLRDQVVDVEEVRNGGEKRQEIYCGSS